MINNKTMSAALMLIMMTSVLAGCVGENTDIEVDTSLVDLQPASANDCPDGGILIHIGIDDNENGNLDTAERTETHSVCNGADGEDGERAVSYTHLRAHET